MLKAKVAYCWELGGGLGHVTRIDSICNRPEFASTDFSFVLKDTNKSKYITKANRQNVYSAPAFRQSPPQYLSPNYAHIMLRCGWQNNDCAYDLVLSWVQILERLDPKFVFIDYAPTAAVAAKLLNIPYLFLGNGFEFPPAEYPFPSILLNQKQTRKDLLKWHNKIQKTLEVVCKKLTFEVDEFDIKNLFTPQRALIIAHPMLDHYLNRQQKVQYLPMLNEVNSAKSNTNIDFFSSKPSVFIYLKAETSHLLESLRVLSEEFIIEGYIPGLNLAQRNALRFVGVNISDEPIQLSKIVARSQLVICHGGIGTVSHAIEHTKPLVLLPTQTEQAMLAHQLCQLGVAKLLSKVSSSNQFLSTVRATANNAEEMQKNIRIRRSKYWDNALIWKKDITGFLKEHY